MTPEDEAFEDIARKQGGGFKAKQAMAADKLQEPEREALKLALEALENMAKIRNCQREKGYPLSDADKRMQTAITAVKQALAQPPQRTWIWLSDADIAEVVDTTCQYSGGYEEYLIKKAERKIRSMNT
jgi:hypothetical protein